MDILKLPENEPFVAGIDVAIDFPKMQLLRTDVFCIFLVSKGHVCVEFDFSRYELTENQLLIVGSGSFFECLESSDELVGSFITFTNDIWLEVTSSFEPAFLGYLRKYPKSPVLQKEQIAEHNIILDAIINIYNERENTFRLKKFKNFLENLLCDIYEKTKDKFLNTDITATMRHEELFKKFIFYVFKNSATTREVKFYADKLCISTRYLSSVVQKITGKTPKEIIDIHCTQEIKTLLRTTSESVQEIAFRLRFPDQSFLARYFKKHTGMSPIEYRKMRN